VRYAILLRALRGVLLRKTGKFAPSEFVSSTVLALRSYKTKDGDFERNLTATNDNNGSQSIMTNSTNQQKDGWGSFIKLCTTLDSARQFTELFDLFLTQGEKDDIAARYEIILELMEGKITQREVAKKHGISIAKISRGSNALKIASQKIKTAIVNSATKRSQ
jgi:TrpR family transcriptional regulator, trp operon repressor